MFGHKIFNCSFLFVQGKLLQLNLEFLWALNQALAQNVPHRMPKYLCCSKSHSKRINCLVRNRFFLSLLA